MASPSLQPLQRVEVRQTIQTRAGPWQTLVAGTILACDLQPTGSWYAHGKHDKLWLRRLRLRKDDGEVVDLVLDERSEVRVLGERP